MVTGVRVSVYVGDDEEFAALKKAAALEKRTVSNYLIWLHELHIGKLEKRREAE
jgi:hypothetical protein